MADERQDGLQVKQATVVDRVIVPSYSESIDFDGYSIIRKDSYSVPALPSTAPYVSWSMTNAKLHAMTLQMIRAAIASKETRKLITPPPPIRSR